jgi:flagellar protein FliS
MYRDANDAYLENRVLSADPIELVRMLYQAAESAVREARRRLEAGEIAARSKAIARACDILAELAVSLDRDRGGEIAARLSRLYNYMTLRLVEANTLQQDALLAEVLGLLGTLAEAWDGVREGVQPAAPAASGWERPAAPDPEPAVASSPWSGGYQVPEPAAPAARAWERSAASDPEPAVASSSWSDGYQAPEPAAPAARAWERSAASDPEPAVASSPWSGGYQVPEPAASRANPWGQPIVPDYVPAPEPHAWSF